MTIYVEYVVIDNMVVNSLILLLTKKILKLTTNKTRIILGSLLGTIFALISPILPTWLNLITKLPLAICMILLAFDAKKIKTMLVELLTFFLVTFSFGGACYGIMNFAGIKVLSNGGIIYQYDYPIGAIILICFVTYLSIKNIAIYLFNKNKTYKFVYEITLFNGNKKIDSLAFLDTGNKICVEEKPVSIINYKLFNKLFPKIYISDILLKKKLNLKNEKYIEIESLSESSKTILTFEIDKICVNNKTITNARCGLALNNFSKNLDADIIISSKLLGD